MQYMHACKCTALLLLLFTYWIIILLFFNVSINKNRSCVVYTCILLLLLFIIFISFNLSLQYGQKLLESSLFFIPIKIDLHRLETCSSQTLFVDGKLLVRLQLFIYFYLLYLIFKTSKKKKRLHVYDTPLTLLTGISLGNTGI